MYALCSPNWLLCQSWFCNGNLSSSLRLFAKLFPGVDEVFVYRCLKGTDLNSMQFVMHIGKRRYKQFLS